MAHVALGPRGREAQRVERVVERAVVVAVRAAARRTVAVQRVRRRLQRDRRRVQLGRLRAKALLEEVGGAALEQAEARGVEGIQREELGLWRPRRIGPRRRLRQRAVAHGSLCGLGLCALLGFVLRHDFRDDRAIIRRVRQTRLERVVTVAHCGQLMGTAARIATVMSVGAGWPVCVSCSGGDGSVMSITLKHPPPYGWAPPYSSQVWSPGAGGGGGLKETQPPTHPI
jgi:hypothetical protein